MTSNSPPDGSSFPVHFREPRPNGETPADANSGQAYPPDRLEPLLNQPELLKALLDQLPHGLIICDAQGAILMVNAAALRLLSLQPDEALPVAASALEDRLHAANGEEKPSDYGYFERALRGETITSEEARIIRPDGTLTIVLISSTPLRSPEGEPAGAAVSLVDITARKHGDDVRSYAAAIVEHSDEPIVGRTLEGTIVTWNAGAERVYGYTASEAIGQHISMLFAHENQDEHPLIVERLGQGEPLLSMDTKRRRKDGGILDISLTISPIRDERGSLIGVSAISHDVTARKEIELAQRTSEQRFRQLADSMPQLVWTALPDGTVDYYNQRYREYQGIVPATAAEGWQWSPVLHPDDLQRTEAAWQHALATGETYEVEHRVYRADGSLRWVLSRGLPVRDDDGRVIRWYGTATDIHDQKMAEDALRRANDQISAILTSIRDGFFTLDNEWKFTYFNDAAEVILNLKAGDVLGRHFLDIFPTAKGTIFEERYRWVIENHKTTAFEAYFETIPYANWYDVRVYPRNNGISIYFQVITERKQAEATIQAQAHLLDQMHDAILVWNREGRIVQWYQGAERLYGWSNAEAIGQMALKLLKIDSTVPWTAVESSLQRNGRWSGEITHVTKDGRQIIVESQMTLVYSADDQQLVLEINRDVTERKWVEQIVAQSHAEVLEQRRRLKTVLSALPVGVVIADREGRLLEANEEATRIWGGVPIVSSIPEYREYHGWRTDSGEELTPEQWPLTRAIRDGEIVEGEVIEIERFDGQRRVVLHAAAPIRDEQSTITGGVVAITDITAQKELEKALRESEQRFRTVLENMPVMLFASDQQGQMVAWNRECEYVTGYSAREIIHNPHALELLMPEPAYRELIVTAWARHESDIRNFEVIFTRKDGTIRHLSWANISRRFPVLGWATWAVGVDITERKEAKSRQLELVSERARVRVLTEFVRDISHDFKTPLSTINASLYLLHKQDEPEKRERHGQVIRHQVARLTRLLEGLLTMTRLDSVPHLTHREVSLTHLVESVEIQMQAPAADKQIQLTFEYPDEALKIEADESELTRAVSELVMNAVQFTQDGGEVTVRLFRERDIAVITVADTGIGIGAEELPRIFDRLYRVDKARSADTGGLGLGLSIARRIVELHQGIIEAESTPGSGSTFRVYLPSSQA